MTAKTLRQSVLQCAMQGKLVPQDPSDEPVSVLLDRIRKEQKKVFGKNYVDTCIYKGLNGRFYEKAGGKEKDITEDIPFEIPESWNWARLGSVYEITMGQSPKGSDVSTGGEGMEFHQGKIFFGSKYLMQSDKKTVKPTKIINRKSVLLCVRAPVGEVNIVDREICVGRGLCAITSRECPIEFLYYLLCALKQSFVRQSAGSTFTEISLDVVKNQLVPIPSLSEQQRIVEALDKIYPLLDEYERLEKESSRLDGEICDKLRNSILQYAIQGKLVPQDSFDESASILLGKIKKEQKVALGKNYVNSYIFKGDDDQFYESANGNEKNITDDIPFEIPGSWEWARIGFVSEFSTGNSISEVEKKTKYTNLSRGRYYIGTKDVGYDHSIKYDNGVRIPDEAENFRIAPKGSVLLCIEGGSAGRKIAVTEEDICFGNKLCCFIVHEINSGFLYYYLQTPLFKEQFKNKTSGIIGGVSMSSMKTMLIPIPPLTEQQRIVEAVDKAFKQVDALEVAIKHSSLA